MPLNGYACSQSIIIRRIVYMGIIISILIGAVCGWLASIIMGSKGGLLWYIVAGLLGGLLGSFVFGILGFATTHLLGQIISGVVGTCLLIFLCRLIFKK